MNHGNCETLVIGFGNSLRGDDAVGPIAARTIAAWDFPNVRCLDVQQLTPELAKDLAAVGFAIFLDARLDDSPDAQAELRAISEFNTTRFSRPWHLTDPNSLLRLAELAFGDAPASWLITIPAVNLQLGEALSETSRRGLENALILCRDLIRELDERRHVAEGFCHA